MKLRRLTLFAVATLCLGGRAVGMSCRTNEEKAVRSQSEETAKSRVEETMKSQIEETVKSQPEETVKWEKGKKLTAEQVKKAGEASLFSIETIDDATFARMKKGGSFPAHCTMKREDLRYLHLLYYDFNGQIVCGEMVCNKTIAQDVKGVFLDLFKIKYPIQRMVLIDDYNANDRASMSANNTSCFCFRVVAGTKTLSNHARGLAIDINPETNPYVKYNAAGKPTYVSPQTEVAKRCAVRSSNEKHMIQKGDECYNIFIKYGFTWGGAWKTTKDWQHFEKK